MKRYLTILIPMMLVLPLAAVMNGAYDAFLKLDGIPGESLDTAFPGWIQALSLRHQLLQPVLTGREAEPVFHDAFTLTKLVDKATPLLNLHCCNGVPIPTMQIALRQSGPVAQEFYQIVFSNVLVTSIQPSGTSQDSDTRPHEAVNFRYGTIAWTYTISAVGVPSNDVVTSGWDLITDTDGDGMPDSFERVFGLNPNLDDASGNLDGDGMRNYDEYVAGTAPNNSNSLFRVSFFGRTGGGTGELTWTSAPGKTYDILGSPQVSGPYTTLYTTASSGAGLITTNVPLTGRTLFFRVHVRP